MTITAAMGFAVWQLERTAEEGGEPGAFHPVQQVFAGDGVPRRADLPPEWQGQRLGVRAQVRDEDVVVGVHGNGEV
ncbi:MAG: hypothetical protein J0M04_24995 [Verrucomicrobia bacterium]|nr:hypothetical protein [Verrucomicrobiota bacterium]